jgi:hypothetical protein
VTADSCLAERDDLPAGRSSTARRFGVAWRNAHGPSIAPIGILAFDGAEYTFAYLRDAEHLAEFRTLLGFPSLGVLYRSTKLFPVFAQRVMDRRRPDYSDYLTELHLPSDASPLDVLARSGGRRKGDSLQVVEEPTVGGDGAVAYEFLIHGARHAISLNDQVLPSLTSLASGDELGIAAEPDNPVNSHALLIVSRDGTPLGWVPDLLIDFVAEVWMQPMASLRVLRVNGPDAPWHLRFVVRLAGFAPAGYQLFSGAAWEVDA